MLFWSYLRHKLLFLVFVSRISPKSDVRIAPVPEAIICCTGEITGPLAARSSILPTCQTKHKTTFCNFTPNSCGQKSPCYVKQLRSFVELPDQKPNN